MIKAFEIAIEARAKTIVELVNACFSDKSAIVRVKMELAAFAAEVESKALEGLTPPEPPKPASIPAHD